MVPGRSLCWMMPRSGQLLVLSSPVIAREIFFNIIFLFYFILKRRPKDRTGRSAGGRTELPPPHRSPLVDAPKSGAPSPFSVVLTVLYLIRHHLHDPQCGSHRHSIAERDQISCPTGR
ncbi:unnamed protein product [Cuscuta europaea]|uniref:Uncharacterized protein n=1 Tax=Cuscuta europaea TaxID=41803 RepID=A0A9P0ZTK5_CUSEU|nr:unnamed protein product [Cuscuta europaea]